MTPPVGRNHGNRNVQLQQQVRRNPGVVNLGNNAGAGNQRFAEYRGRSGWQLDVSQRPGMPALRGDLAPGGRYDPTRVGDNTPGSQTLYARSYAAGPMGMFSGHSYAVLSDPMPRGTTWAQANDALQRFNAPTRNAYRGVPGDPNSTAGTVVMEGSGLPAGRVTFERGDGWVRNTTTVAHPLIGSITRRIVQDQNGQYRILTEGTGSGGPMGALRHLINRTGIPGVVPGGPVIFSRMDEITLRYVRQQVQQAQLQSR